MNETKLKKDDKLYKRKRRDERGRVESFVYLRKPLLSLMRVVYLRKAWSSQCALALDLVRIHIS